MVRRARITAALAAVVALAGACGDPASTSPTVLGAAVSADGALLLVSVAPPDVEGRSCWAGAQATVTPTPAAVELRLSARASTAGGCAPSPWRVPLAEPLAGRRLRDVTGRADVPVLPVRVPEPTWLPDGWTVLWSGGTDRTWHQSVGVDGTLQRVEIVLASAADPDPNLQAAVVTASVTVQGRAAALVRPRYATGGADWLVASDAAWRLVLFAPDASVTADTVRAVAEGLRPLPLAAATDPPVIAPARAGTVAELVGYEGPATVTGWLTLAATGEASLCERLDGAGACADASLHVDWDTGRASPPPGLTALGDRRVSATAIRLDGTVKGSILFVGV